MCISCKEDQHYYCINFSLKAANINFAMQPKGNIFSLKAISANFNVVVVFLYFENLACLSYVYLFHCLENYIFLSKVLLLLK